MSHGAHRTDARAPMERSRLRRLLTGVVVLAVLAVSAGIAQADVVVNSVSVAGKTTVVADGTSTAVVTYTIQNTNQNNATFPDTQNNCNPANGTAATLTVNVPADVTVTPASRSYTGCDAGQQFTFKATEAGDHVITVSVADAGGGTYYTAPATFTLEATAPAPTAAPTALAVSSATAAFDDADVALSATLTSGSPAAGVSGKSVSFTVGTTTVGSGVTTSSGVATFSYPLDKNVAAGTYALQAVWAGDSTHAAKTSDAGTLTVTRAAQSITFAQPADGDVDDTFAVNPVAGSGLPVTLTTTTPTVCTLAGFDVTLVAAGTCTLAANQAGNTNWDGAQEMTRSLTVSKVAQTITVGFDPASATYRGGDVTVTATSTSDLPVSVVVKEGPCAISGNTLSLTGAGNCVVTASQAGNSRYEAASTDATLNIAKAAQTITFAQPDDRTFGDPTFSLGASASSGLPVSYSALGDCSVSATGTVTIDGAGSCAITASQAGDADFNAADSVTRTIQIAKANQTIDFTAPTGKTFGDPAFALAATATSELPVSFAYVSGPCTVTNGQVTSTGAGDCVVRASQGGNDDYNAAPAVDGTIFFAKANQTITFDQPAGKTFGDAPFALVASSTSGLDVAFAQVSGPCTVANGSVTITGAGSCVVDAAQPGDANYNAATTVRRTIVIDKANQTITFAQPANKTYGDAAFPLGATATSGLVVTYTASGPCTTVEDVLTITGAGTCEVTASQGGNGNYNPATSVARTVTIAKANQPTLAVTTSVAGGYVDTVVTLGTTGGAGTGAVTYSVGSSTACTVAGNLLTITRGSGSCSVVATKAGDDNHNQAVSAAQPITLSAWRVGGFYSPVDLNGVYNTVKGGSTVPVKFELFQDTRELTSTTDVVGIAQKTVSCSPTATVDEIEVLAATTGGTALRYDTTAGQYVYNWKTPTGAGKCYQITMTARDGSTQTALFKMK